MMNIFDGPLGESLFEKPVLRLFRHNPLPEFFAKAEKIDDDRFVAVVTALIVEDRLDACLGSFLPRYSILLKTQDFTLANKIRLMQALDFVPRLLLSASDLIRSIRNEFAHNLEQETFAALSQALQKKLVSLRAEIYSRFGKEERQPKDSLRAEFKALAFFAIAGLDTYCENLAILRQQIANRDFIEGLYSLVAAENKTSVQAVLASKPTSVEIRDGLKVERYEQGVVNVSNISQGKHQ
jgi:hypothetical protein